MDKLTKRIMFNPDGSSVMKQWDDSVVVKGKLEPAFESQSSAINEGQKNPIYLQPLDELDGSEERHLDEIGYNWATEIDY